MGSKTEKPNDAAAIPEIEELKALVDLMKDENLDVLEIKNEDGRIYLSRQQPAASYVPAGRIVHSAARAAATQPAAAAEVVAHDSVKAPLSGVFYRASSPARPPFAKEGDIVDAGQTLCIVEAMKMMNEIKAEKRCKIVKILAENSRPVTVEQDLFWIEPA